MWKNSKNDINAHIEIFQVILISGSKNSSFRKNSEFRSDSVFVKILIKSNFLLVRGEKCLQGTPVIDGHFMS